MAFGTPTCGVRLLPGIDVPADLDRDPHCAREGETWPLLHNAQWLPFVIAHGLARRIRAVSVGRSSGGQARSARLPLPLHPLPGRRPPVPSSSLLPVVSFVTACLESRTSG